MSRWVVDPQEGASEALALKMTIRRSVTDREKITPPEASRRVGRGASISVRGGNGLSLSRARRPSVDPTPADPFASATVQNS